MVKKRGGKKTVKDGSDDSDVDSIEDVTENVDNLSLKAGGAKAKTKKKQAPQPRGGFELLLSGNEDGDSSADSEDSEPPVPSKPGKGKAAKKVEDQDDSDGEEENESTTKSSKAKQASKKNKKQSAKDEDSANSDPEESTKSKPAEETGKGGKKAKRKKKKEESDEDIEKILAELQMEYAGQKPPGSDTQEGKTKKSEKMEKTPSEETESSKAEGQQQDDEPAEEAGSTVKSAAQKKREKKLQKKQAQKQTAGKPAEENESGAISEKPVVPKEEETEPKPDDQPADDGKKKKSKKGAAAEVKEEKKPAKKNKMIQAIQEAQRRAEEEAERLRKEAEEEEARLAAQEEARLEAERLETERKERKKKKEKEKKERLKAEGKLLTPKQKADRARAQAMLEAMGIAPPAAGEKKLRPGSRIRPNKNKQQTQQTEESVGSESRESSAPPGTDAAETATAETAEASPQPEVVEEVKESWDAESDHSAEEDPGSESAVAPPTVAAPVAVAEPAVEQKAPAPEESASDEEEEGSEEESDSEDSEDASRDHLTEQERKRAKAVTRIEKRKQEAEKNRSPDILRAAVICVLGHVDTGKTKILDKLRRTSVQAGEAGGITQQIGATNVPMDAIKEQTKFIKGFSEIQIKLPGLLIIDTPGHASFSNLRSRGSSLCDMAILVVDIMHGLEEQTLESINLLKAKKTPFVVALNKIDRLYDWNTMPRKDIRDILKAQASNTMAEFERRTKDVILQFAEQGLNAALFYDNPDVRSYVSLVPTSAITGEGMGNLLALLVQNCQNMLTRRLMYSEELQATVLEVKAITGLGTTIDCILVNGRLREGDTVVLASSDGNAIVTQIRSLLMPQPMKELRVKNEYIEYREIQAAQGVKIAAKDLEKAIAGLNMLVAHHPDEVELCKEEVVRDLARELGRIKLQATGVLVQASTLGSLEALLEFLKDSKIPYSSVKIGPVVKKDVMRAASMLERESQYGTILAFDVKVERDAQEYADSLGVKIFQADIIYHLFDQFTAHREQLRQSKRQQYKNIAVFPCKLRILPQYVFNSRDPIVAGVIVEDGIVCVGTPICVPNKEEPSQFIDLGVVTSIENNHKAAENARRGQEVCIKIECTGEGAPKMFGRHFDEKDMLVSKISRQSIDACKEYFREDLLKSDWQLMVELKKVFQIL